MLYESGSEIKRKTRREKAQKPSPDFDVTIINSGEAEIMRIIWDFCRPVTVRDVYDTLWDKEAEKLLLTLLSLPS